MTRKIFKNRDKFDIPCPEPVTKYNQTHQWTIREPRDYLRRVESSPVTGLEWPRGFQEVKVPRFHDNGTGRR